MLFNKVTILGIGLIGSSLARNIKEKNIAQELCVYDINPIHLEQAKDLQLADCCTSNIKEAVNNAELIIFATPVCSFENLAKECKKYAPNGAIITDTGSVKEYALNEIEKHLNKNTGFIVVGSHPVAGTEKSGPTSGFSLLFKDRWCILTPDNNSTPDAIKKVTNLWQLCDMKTDIMTPSHHDKVMAAVSHLPQLIAYSIVGTVDDLEDYEHKEIIKYSAGGFRDFTRIAGSDPTMWRDIFLTNKKPVLELIQRFIEDLIALERNIRWDEGDKIHALFTRTQKIRKDVIEAKQHQPEEEKRLKETLQHS
ncbi:MAG: prephenate dehydrogenase/arogenate dehydrogenase family protein, partial [Alphaproteobacteria bacterium]|nr:prephenate dehydrogenase/arogenate dehydrogenase family protein [Alphaproteobacteria bacterium]